MAVADLQLNVLDVRRSLVARLRSILEAHDAAFAGAGRVEGHLRKVFLDGAASRGDLEAVVGKPPAYCQCIHTGNGDSLVVLADGATVSSYVFEVTLWYRYQDDASGDSFEAWDDLLFATDAAAPGLVAALADDPHLAVTDEDGTAVGDVQLILEIGAEAYDVLPLTSEAADLVHRARFTITAT